MIFQCARFSQRNCIWTHRSLTLEGVSHLVEIEKRAASPFLKWAGGKSLIADKIISRLDLANSGSRYIETFLGGGAVFFRLLPRRAVLIDSNVELIGTYLAVKNHVEKLIDELESLGVPSDREEYLSRRTEFNEMLPASVGQSNSENVRRSALLIWLNHTCYNGLYRVNKKGKFNVPFGDYRKPHIFDPRNLRNASHVLKSSHANLRSGDYTAVLRIAKKGDAIYFDPPYQPIGKTANFTNYTPNGFGFSDQKELASVFAKLASRGCSVVMSNSSVPEVVHLYSKFQMEKVEVPRAINSVGLKRGSVEELLVFA